MRRMSAFLAAVVATAAMFAAATTDTAVAKTVGCGTGTSAKKTDDMHMDHDMGSMEQNCPVVAGARQIDVTGTLLRFKPAVLTIAAAENVTIKLSADDVAHDFYVQGIGHVVHAKAGKTALGGLRIKKAGTYKYWCTIKGHKQAGMKGTITVTA
jgi:plastocyanin